MMTAAIATLSHSKARLTVEDIDLLRDVLQNTLDAGILNLKASLQEIERVKAAKRSTGEEHSEEVGAQPTS